MVENTTDVAKKQNRMIHVTISGDTLTRFKELANDMDANYDVVFSCALSTLDWIVQHTKKRR